MATEIPTEALEAAARAIAGRVKQVNHGQLCPVWTQKAPIERCDCWILREARVDAGIAVAAAAALLIATTRRESRNLTALCGVRLTPDEHARGTERARVLGMTLPSLLRSLLLDLLGDRHVYLSSACRHANDPGREGEDLHRKCQTDAIRYDGTHKIAGQCKECGAPCICPCHQEATDG